MQAGSHLSNRYFGRALHLRVRLNPSVARPTRIHAADAWYHVTTGRQRVARQAARDNKLGRFLEQAKAELMNHET